MDNTHRITLSKSVAPKNYKLRIKPDLKAFSFEVHQSVTLAVKESVKEIIANAKDLKFSSAQVIAGGATQKAVITLDEKTERVTFALEQPLAANSEAELQCSFTGELNDKLKGFYRSKYTVGSEERYMAVTQFEPVDARRALVCWDEPNVKSTFEVTLVVPKNRLAISNMNVVSETDDGDWKVVQFARTPVMSVYLLAYIVGEFDFVQDKTPNGVQVRVYTPLGKGEQGRFALQVAVKTLPFYDSWFGTPYPLPKIDLLAIADFAAGAMENWGAVTYRETALLVDAKTSSSATRQWVALVVGHELAHQWFGNLVTMDWWTHLWLNEGFASWIEYLCVDHCFPEWDIWAQFVYADAGQAFLLDALANSHPVEVPINDPAEIDTIFDAISYSKGCSIIRMLHNWVGNDKFKAALHNYLRKFQYANAVTEDLWQAIGDASALPVKALMETWTKQTGYPVLLVESELEQGAERVYTFRQQRFLSTGAVETDQRWLVPVGIASASHPQAVYTVLSEKTGSVAVKATATDWVKFNPGQTGFYRVKYPSAMLPQLRHAIQHHQLPPVDRLGVQNDALALAKAGVVPIADALDVVQSFHQENNYTVWADLSSKLSELEMMISNTDLYADWKHFAHHLYSHVTRHVGWDAKPNEPHTTSLLRSLVLAKMGKYGHQPTIDEAKRRFERYLADRSSLSPDLRTVVYVTVVARQPATYDSLLRLFREADGQEEKVRCLRALGAAEDTALLQRTLAFATSAEVRSQDAVLVLQAVGANPIGREPAWQFMQQHWDELTKKYEGGFLLTRLIGIAAHFATEEKAAEVEKFFAAHPVPGNDRTIKQTIESIRSSAKWLQRDREHIKQWLTHHKQHHAAHQHHQ